MKEPGIMRLVPILVGLAGFAVPAQAQKELPPAPGTPRSFRVPPRKTLVLPSGMKVTLVPYGTIPKVAVSLQLATGAIDESREETQLSALTAALLVEGTSTRSGQDISRQAADMGGTVTAGSSDNAITIGGEALSESAAPFITLIADVVRHPRFAPADVERLRTNLIRDNAIALSQPEQLTRARFREMIFGDHPYGRVFAPESVLASFTAEKVRAFHTRNFGARRAHLYVSGVYDAASVERAVRAAFRGWAAGPAPTVRPPTPVDHRQLSLMDRPDAVQSSIRVGLPVPDPGSPDWIRLNVTDAILGGAFGSRITTNLREDKGYSYSPFSFVGSWPGTGLWVEVASVTSAATGPSLKEVFYEVGRLRREAPPERELDGIKNNMVGIFTIQNSSRGGLIGQLQFVDQYGLGDAYLSGYVSRVLGVTPDEVKSTATRYLDPDRMTIMVVGDRKVVDEQLAPYRAGVP
jgi:predicted Zn-dependent peptidase